MSAVYRGDGGTPWRVPRTMDLPAPLKSTGREAFSPKFDSLPTAEHSARWLELSGPTRRARARWCPLRLWLGRAIHQPVGRRCQWQWQWPLRPLGLGLAASHRRSPLQRPAGRRGPAGPGSPAATGEGLLTRKAGRHAMGHASLGGPGLPLNLPLSGPPRGDRSDSPPSGAQAHCQCGNASLSLAH
jgi:hypothetical protein